MAKHCCYGTCNSDSRRGRPGYVDGLKFYTFPQPCLLLRDNVLNWNDGQEKSHMKSCSKCKISYEWLIRCKRNDAKLSTRIRQIYAGQKICAKHFANPPDRMDYAKYMPQSENSVAAESRVSGRYQLLAEKRGLTNATTSTNLYENSVIEREQQAWPHDEMPIIDFPCSSTAPYCTSSAPHTSGMPDFPQVKPSMHSEFADFCQPFFHHCAEVPMDVPDADGSASSTRKTKDQGIQVSFPILQSRATQTNPGPNVETLSNKIDMLKKVVQQKEDKISQVTEKLKMEAMRQFEEKVTDDDKVCKFYTGMDHEQLDVLLRFFVDEDISYWGEPAGRTKTNPRKLTRTQEILIFFLRFKGGLLVEDISYRFNLSTVYVSQTVTTWVLVMKTKFSALKHQMFPPRDVIKQLLPPRFQNVHFKNIRVILDCAEIFVQRASNFEQQSNTFSDYKAHTTYKVLLGCAPNGTVTFVSDLFEGSISDRAIVEQSGLIELLEEGDQVLADRGFTIKDLTDSKGAILKIPAFLKGRDHLTPQEEVDTRVIAANRIFVEHVVGRLKNFRLFQRVLPMTMTHIVSQAVFVCACLLNFQEPFVK